VKEVDVLRLLIDNRHQALPRDYILSQVWGIDSDITTRTVDNFIHRLRQKIEDDPTNPQNILTVHGVGYKLI
jgi:DNA-binding response OmpR family regulator